MAEHLSLLVAQPHRVVNFSLALVNKATGERCCAGDVRPGICHWGLVSVALLCTCLLCPVGGLGRAPFWHDFVPAKLLRCNSKWPARHTSLVGPR